MTEQAKLSVLKTTKHVNGLTLYVGKITLTPMTEISLILLKLTQHDWLYLTAVAIAAKKMLIKDAFVQNF